MLLYHVVGGASKKSVEIKRVVVSVPFNASFRDVGLWPPFADVLGEPTILLLFGDGGNCGVGILLHF